MDKEMFLVRRKWGKDGVFGELMDRDTDLFLCTLEHAYEVAGTGSYQSKLSPGRYRCFRRFSNHFQAETFEVEGVKWNESFGEAFGIEEGPDHFAILFHVGNYNDESAGCILLGKQLGNKAGGGFMLMNSKGAFQEFMDSLKGHQEFWLTVE
jgi:hypothetical protein